MFHALKTASFTTACTVLAVALWWGCGDDPQTSKVDPCTNSACEHDEDTSDDEDTVDDTDTDPGPKPLVNGLDIVGIELYQSTRIPVMEDGLAAPWNDIPLIDDKDALLRVFVERQPEWTERSVSLVLELEYPGRSGEIVQEDFTVSVDSSIDELVSTLNLEIPAALVEPGLSLGVSLLETDYQIHDGDSDLAGWPPDSPAPVEVEHPGADLKIVLVPIRYNADGSERLPDLSADQLAEYENLFLATYPISDVTFEMADVLDWDDTVGPQDLAAWNDLLSAIMQLRNDSNVDYENYVYGLVSPADTYAEYCASKCFSGLSHAPFETSSDWLRVGIGLGYPSQRSAETMIHEIGHNHGRLHAPAGDPPPDTIDDAYPIAGGLLDDWGYDRRTETLLDPAVTYDFMAYANDVWVSAYTYRALLDWAIELNTPAPQPTALTATTSWSSVVLLGEGRAQRGPTLDLTQTPQGARQMTVELLDAAHQVVDTYPGTFHPNSQGGGLVLFPTPTAPTFYVRVAGYNEVSL